MLIFEVQRSGKVAGWYSKINGSFACCLFVFTVSNYADFTQDDCVTYWSLELDASLGFFKYNWRGKAYKQYERLDITIKF